MRQIWSIATKELRGYFNSAVAVIFLATFLGVALFTFFWVEEFFARNLADVTPLFRWLPILLIFLVAALTMRLWSEEHKTGTIEVLLTLPVPIYRLVIGKFLAGLMLVSLALMLTFGLPATVSAMGNLDWGPVIGGYVGALLLAGAYLAIGLCISSTTENQIVALIGTILVGAIFYLPGVDAVSDLFGVRGGELLRLIGTGSRFESVARGVLDLRDLAYYAALIALFLTLNTVLLESKRWSHSERTRASRRNTRVAVALVVLNALALNLWLQPVTAVRVDLTEDSTYSLSEPTEKLLASLEEPLLLRGYFSDRTHPLLVPLVPQIRNMLEEYKIAGGSRVKVEIVDPSKNEDLEAEAFDKFGIKPTPFQFAGRHEQSIVNAYFHVLVSYGDQYEVLGVGDLIEVNVVDIDNVQAYVDNLEYEITKNIRKAVYGFQSVEALFANMPGEIELLAFVTPETIPEPWKQVPGYIDTIAGELESESGGKFSYERVAPSSPEEQKELFQTYGIRPIPTSLLSEEHFYLHLLMKLDDRLELVPLPEEMSESSLRTAMRTTIERLAPGFTKVVGMVTPKPEITNPPMPGMPAPPPRAVQNFQTLSRALSETYQVRNVDIESGAVPDDVDVLLVAGPDNLGDDSRKAIDQFLMRGGAVVVLAGKFRLNLGAQRGVVQLEEVTSGIDDLLARYGVDVDSSLILDEQNDAFPMPAMRNIGGTQIQVVERLDYPFFVRVSSEGMEDGGIITSDLASVIMHWASPIEVSAPEGDAPAREVKKLLLSSEKAWLQTDTNVRPDFNRYPELGFGPPAEPNPAAGGEPPYALAVAVTGIFESALEKDEAAGTEETAVKAAENRPVERLLESSTPDARLVVVGSSTFVSDTGLLVSEQSGSRDVGNNLKLVQNILDWAVEDTELLSIRTRGSTARTLGDVPEDERSKWEIGNYAIALIGLFLVIAAARMRRRAQIRAASRIIMPTAVPTQRSTGAGKAKQSSSDNDKKHKKDKEEKA